MNRRASSLIAVRDGADEQANRYLTYYDQQWECWFLPNHSSSGSYEEDKTKLIGYMTSEFKIPLRCVRRKIRRYFHQHEMVHGASRGTHIRLQAVSGFCDTSA